MRSEEKGQNEERKKGGEDLMEREKEEEVERKYRGGRTAECT